VTNASSVQTAFGILHGHVSIFYKNKYIFYSCLNNRSLHDRA